MMCLVYDLKTSLSILVSPGELNTHAGCSTCIRIAIIVMWHFFHISFACAAVETPKTGFRKGSVAQNSASAFYPLLLMLGVRMACWQKRSVANSDRYFRIAILCACDISSQHRIDRRYFVNG